MRDYSNYHNYDPLERRLRNGKKIFEVSKRGINSYKAIVDGKFETDLIIERAYNPYSEKKEERILKCDLDTKVELGSTFYIEEENQTFISVTPINRNRIFQFFKGLEMNYTLNWVDKDGNLHSTLCCMYDKDVYSVGVKEIQFIPTLHEQIFLTLQQDESSDTIDRGTRFIIDGDAWEATNVSRALGRLMKVALKEVAKDRDDNLEDEIPNEDGIKKHSVKILNGSDITMSKGQSFKLTTEVYRGDKLLEGAKVSYKSLNPIVANVSSDGIISGVSVGTTAIEAQYNDVKTSIEVNIEEEEVITYKAIIEGLDSIRNGRRATYTNKPTANGEPIELISEWCITDENDNPTSLATIEPNGHSCIVEATKKNQIGIVKLHVKCVVENTNDDGLLDNGFNEIVRDYKLIEIKGIFAP